MPGDMQDSNPDMNQESGENISIDTSNYPDLAQLQEGDDVTLKIKGKVQALNDGVCEIAPQSITQTDVNPAKAALKDLTGSGRKQAPAPSGDSSEDY